MASRGTSLAELLVVLALIGLMVLVAADLVVHSVGLLGATGRSVRNPLVVHLTARLRQDVERAAGIKTVAPVWSEGPLELWTQEGEIVRYSLSDGRLVRQAWKPPNPLPDERVILRGATAWWWQSPVVGVVDIRLGYLVNPEPEKHASRAVGWGRVRREERLRFAVRTAGGGRKW